MFLKKLYIFFWKLEDRHDGKFKKILDVSKIKKRWRRNLFCDFFQWKRARKDTLEACTICCSASVVFWYYLRGSRRRERSFNADLFSTRFFPPLRRSFFLFPFPIVFRSRNFFFVFLSLLMSTYLGLYMSETRLNLLFLMVLLSRSETDWRSIDTAFYFVCIFFYIFQENLRFFFFLVMSIFFFFFLFSFWCLNPPLSSLSLLSLSYLEICLMLPPPPQFPPPPLFFEICSFVSGGTRWMKEEER